MRLLIAAILISTAAMATGCSERSYLDSFQLRPTVCRLSYPGIDCSHPESGGIWSVGGGFGGSGSKGEHSVSSTEIFYLREIAPGTFDPTTFRSELASSIRRDLVDSGYEIVESPDDVIRYKSSGLTGQLEIKVRLTPDQLFVDLNGRESRGR